MTSYAHQPATSTTAIVVALGSARCWIGSADGAAAITPAPLHLQSDGTLRAGELAAAIVAAFHLPTLNGRRVVVTGARTRAERLATAHALLQLLRADSVRFLSDADSARVAVAHPQALVVDVGHTASRIYVEGGEPGAIALGGVAAMRDGVPEYESVARALHCETSTGPIMKGRTILMNVEKRALPDRLFDVHDDERNVAMAVLRALGDARVLQRAEATRTIVVTGGGGALAGFGLRLLREMRERCAKDNAYAFLGRLLQSARIAHSPFCPSLLPWIGAVVVARSKLQVGILITANGKAIGVEACPYEHASEVL